MLYHINEFAVDSDFDFPVDARQRSPRAIPDTDIITVRRASLADLPCTMRRVYRKLCYDVGDGVLIEPRIKPEDRIAIHVNHNGRAITVDAVEDSLNPASLWTIHVGLAAATLFRGDLTLHGSGLEIDGRFFSIMANSGTGKSTLSFYLLQNGARFGCDDVVPVRNIAGQMMAFPSVSLYPKLRRDAADRSGLNIADLLRAIDTGKPKEEYWVPLRAEQRVVEPMPLRAMFLLQPLPEVADLSNPNTVHVERLSEKAAADTLLQNLQGVWVVGQVLKQQRLQQWVRTLTATVPLYVLRYVKCVEALPRLNDAIRAVLREHKSERNEGDISR